MKSIFLLLIVLLVMGFSSTLFCQQAEEPHGEVPTYTIYRTTHTIQVDGRIDEPDWEQAPSVRFCFPWDEVQEEGMQETVARMLWDDTRLYIIYECDDPYLDSQVTEHDGPVYDEDAVEVFLTPNPDDLGSYYGFEMNIKGTVLDYIAGGAGNAWQGEDVLIATTFDGTLNDHADVDRSWILEMAIPFANFRELGGDAPPQDGEMWRLNLNRCKGYRGQFSLWSDTHTSKPSFHQPEYFGQVFFSTAPVSSGTAVESESWSQVKSDFLE